MKISVITPVFNGQETLRSCIQSVLNQTYADKEYIVVDGGSNDKTVEILKTYPPNGLKWISEKDKGLYDAFNKGIRMSTGDIICFLCADDMYTHENVLQTISTTFKNHRECDIVYGDIIYVNRKDLNKIDRYWKSSSFRPGLFKKGWLPPNTALFIRRNVFDKYGVFNLKFKFASDVDLQYRFFEIHRLKTLYTPGILVTMRSGGISNSSWRGMYKSLKECYDSLKSHKVRFPFLFVINTLFYRLNQIFIPKEIKRIYKATQTNFLK